MEKVTLTKEEKKSLDLALNILEVSQNGDKTHLNSESQLMEQFSFITAVVAVALMGLGTGFCLMINEEKNKAILKEIADLASQLTPNLTVQELIEFSKKVKR